VALNLPPPQDEFGAANWITTQTYATHSQKLMDLALEFSPADASSKERTLSAALSVLDFERDQCVFSSNRRMTRIRRRLMHTAGVLFALNASTPEN
jgi:hypothetical protein